MVGNRARGRDMRGARLPQPLGPALVVEDDPLIALWVADVLREGGADPVETCGTTEAAREALERLAPRVVVLDARLSDRDDGWAFAELLPLLGPARPQVIFATGAPETIPPHVAALGTVLAKPYAPEALLAAIAPQGRGGLMARIRGALGSS